MGRRRQLGFTLLELLVVVGIMLLLSAILITFWGQSRRSAARYQALSNMRLIYSALRQYQLDENGSPPFDPRNADAFYAWQTSGTALPPIHDPRVDVLTGNFSLTDPSFRYPWYGLWALVETGALESSAYLHDPQAKSVRVASAPSVDHPSGSRQAPLENAFFWCSYQTWDPEASQGNGAWIYLPNRGVDQTADPTSFRRQLWPYPTGTGQQRWMPAGSTVVLWSRWHRDGKNPTTPVLFADGSVKYIGTFTEAADSAFTSDLAQ